MSGRLIMSRSLNGCLSINVFLPPHGKACFVGVDVDSSSALYSEGFVCWIDVGQYFNPYVTFLRRVLPPFPAKLPQHNLVHVP